MGKSKEWQLYYTVVGNFGKRIYFNGNVWDQSDISMVPYRALQRIMCERM